MSVSAAATLATHIRKFVSLTEEEARLLADSLKYQTLEKKRFLLEPGKICRANYFVVKGCMRLFFVNNKGKEQITQFAIENWWITDYDSLESGEGSGYYIQALENTEVIVLEKKQIEPLFARIPVLERYFRIVLQRAHAASLRRIEYIYRLTDEERYNHFHNLFPEFVQRVPQYMLASYLGFTPEFLSKIRAKKA
jgi:CRP/FNR family transcriptional regulator